MSGRPRTFFQEAIHFVANPLFEDYHENLRFSRALHEYHITMSQRNKEHNASNPLFVMSGDVLDGVFQYLGLEDIGNFSLVCHQASEVSKVQKDKRIKREIDDRLPPMLVEALGGKKAVHHLPVLDLQNRMGPADNIDFLKPKDLRASIISGVDRLGRLFIALCFMHKDIDGNAAINVVTLFKRYSDSSCYFDSSNTWAAGGVYHEKILLEDRPLFFDDPIVNLDLDDSQFQSLSRNNKVNVIKLERLKRLVQGKPVGETRVFASKPVGDDFVNSKLFGIGYERRVEDGMTDIVLWDPSKSREENIASFKCKTTFNVSLTNDG